MSGRRFGRCDGDARAIEHAADRGQFGGVAERRRRGVGIDVSDLRRLDTGGIDRQPHAALQAFAIGRRRRHAVGVRRGAIADDFGERRRAARQRMIQRLDYQNGGALAHDEAVALRIERPRGALRFVVEMRRQRARRRETGQADALDAAFRAAADGDIGFAAADQAGAIAERLQTGGAGGDRCADRPAKTVMDRNLPGCEIDQERRHGERRQLARAALVDDVHRLLHGGEAANAGGEEGGGAVALGVGRRRPA